MDQVDVEEEDVKMGKDVKTGRKIYELTEKLLARLSLSLEKKSKSMIELGSL